MPDEPKQHPLIGLIASWPNAEDDDGPLRIAGRGEVIAVLPDGYSCSVEVQPRADEPNPHPTIMLIVPADDPGVLFFKTLIDEDVWYEWLMADPDAARGRVVRLIESKPTKPPKK
jgi:hypothetical protein